MNCWSFHCLDTERKCTPDAVFTTMSLDELLMTADRGVVGTLSDWLFKRTRRGRLIVSTVDVPLEAVCSLIPLCIPVRKESVPSPA